jgi:Fur family ferric uptake transcriptional regulator
MNQNGWDSACRLLEDNSRRLTPQRRFLLQIFIDQPGRHFSAEEIYLALQTVKPTLGMATVYRSLELFKRFGIIRKIETSEGVSRYEYNDGKYHCHLICLKCGRITEFYSPVIQAIETQIGGEFHFQVAERQLNLYGYCEQCQGKDLPEV